MDYKLGSLDLLNPGLDIEYIGVAGFQTLLPAKGVLPPIIYLFY